MSTARATIRATIATGAVLLLTASGCHHSAPSGTLDLDAVPTLPIRQDLRIGSRDNPDVGFTRPIGVDVDRDGNTYVAEASTMEIRVYGPDGVLLRHFGGRGDGPGQFQSMRFGVKGDTVWVVDLTAQRITLFDRQGKLLSANRVAQVTVSLPPRGQGHILPRRMRPDGLFSSSLDLIAYSRGMPESSVPDSVPVPRVLFDGTGAVVDTVGWDNSPPPRMWRPPGGPSYAPQVIHIGGRPFMVPSPPVDLPFWLPLDDGEIRVRAPIPASSNQGTVIVTRVGLHRDTVYERHLSFKPVAYSSADLDSIASRYAHTPGLGMPIMGGESSAPDNAGAVQAAMRAAMKFPDFHPGIQYPWLDQNNRVWLHLDLGTGAPNERWVILDTNGKPVGAVDLPPGTQILWSRKDAFWTVQRDEMDVPWLVRYRMEKTP